MLAPIVYTQVACCFGPKLIQAMTKVVGQDPSWHDHHRIRAIVSSTTNNARKHAGRTQLPGQVRAYGSWIESRSDARHQRGTLVP